MNTLTGIYIPKQKQSENKPNFSFISTFKNEIVDTDAYKYLLIGDLSSIYLLYLYDKKTNISYLMQSRFGFYLPIYYWKTSSFGFSTTIKEINKYVKFELNFKTTVRFIFRKDYYLNGKSTLLKNIYKLEENEYLEIDHNKNKLYVKKAFQKNIRIKNPLTKIISCVEKSLVDLAKKRTSLSLSGGTDSNLLFKLFLKNGIYPTVYTTALGNITEDLVIVKKNLKRMGYLKSKFLHIEKNFSDMIQVVWITEGLTITRGFLLQQYNLLKSVPNEIVYGVGADVLFVNEKCSKNRLFYIKQIGVIANHFNVVPIFPFLNYQVDDLSKSMLIRDKKRAIYKQIAKAILEKNIEVLDKKDIITNDVLLKIKYTYYFYKLFIQQDKKYLDLLKK